MYKVLIVDDEPLVREGLKTIIDWQKYGFEVCALASNGLQALAMAIDYKPDLILVDIKMPGLSGIELIQQLRKEKQDYKIFVLSGYSDFNFAQKAMNNGALAYLLKPIDENELIDHLQKILKLLENEKSYLQKLLEKDGHVKIDTNLIPDSVVNNLLIYIEENVYKPLKLKDLAKDFNYEAAYLGKLFKSNTGVSFNEHVENVKMKEAAKMLARGHKISEIAERLGFLNPEYFCIKFKKRYGVTPSLFKKDIK